MTKVLLLWVSVILGGGMSSAQNFTNWNELGDMSTYQHIKSARWIYHLEADIYKTGHVIYTDGKTLRSTDGATTTLIAGSEFSSYYSYNDGIAEAAEFSTILGFTQLNTTHIVAADLYNHCLRLINRITRKTSTYSGLCGSENSGLYDGKLSKFAYPAAVTKDRRPGKNGLLVLDRNNNAIRSVDEEGHVTTLIQSDELDRPVTLTWDAIDPNIVFVSNKNHISRLDLSNLTLTLLAGDVGKSGFRDGTFNQALFRQPRAILTLNENRLLVADQDNNKLRILDLDDLTVASVCSGVRGHNDGDSVDCETPYPHSMMMSPEGDVLIGEIGGYIRKLQEEHFRRVIQYTAQYTLDCSLLDNNVTRDYMEILAERNYGIVDRLCDSDCESSKEFSPVISCSNGTMTISWPTAPSLGREVVKIPSDVEQRLTEALLKRRSAFYMLAKTESGAQVLYPKKNDEGAVASLSLLELCANHKTYISATQQCV